MRRLAPLPRALRGRGGAPLKRNQIWQRENAANVGAMARTRVSKLVEHLEPQEFSREINRYVSHHRREPSPQAQLDVLCHIIGALEIESLDHAMAKRLISVGREILAEQSVDPRRSRLAPMHAAIEASAARIARNSADAWSASWHQAFAGLSTPSDISVGALNPSEDLALLAGDAESHVRRVLASEGDLENPATLTALRARLLRLSGKNYRAIEVLEESIYDTPALTWERATAHATQTRELNHMAAHLRRPIGKNPANQLDFWLWAHAIPSRRWRRESVKLQTISRRLTGGDHALACARAIDELTRRTSKPLERLRRLGDALHASVGVQSVQRELLIWSAASRCLKAAKQPRFAEACAARYVALSRVASAGESLDVLGVDVQSPTGMKLPSWNELEVGLRQKRIPATARSRYLEVGKMTVGIAMSKLRGIGAREQEQQSLLLLTDHLNHLKGPLLKLGQLMTHYGLGLTQEESSRLGALYDGATGIDSSAIFQVLDSEIGSIDQAFDSIEEQPFAAGSIGQVHRATTREGRRVAVKIQYPQIEDAIQADLRLLKLARPVLARLVPKWPTSALLAELEAMLTSECDYVAEAANQRAFSKLFADSPEIHIPDVLSSHSSRRVLTTELADGERIDVFARRSDEHERVRAAEYLAKFIVRSGITAQLGHTDPHPGNFLVRSDSLCVLDFGSVKRWPEPHWRSVLLACMEDDPTALHDAFSQMGMLAGPLDCARVLEKLKLYTMRWTAATDGKAAFAPDDVAEEIKIWLTDESMSNLIVQPTDLFGFRMYWGSFALLGKLAAPVDLQAIVETELSRDVSQVP